MRGAAVSCACDLSVFLELLVVRVDSWLARYAYVCLCIYVYIYKYIYIYTDLREQERPTGWLTAGMDGVFTGRSVGWTLPSFPFLLGRILRLKTRRVGTIRQTAGRGALRSFRLLSSPWCDCCALCESVHPPTEPGYTAVTTPALFCVFLVLLFIFSSSPFSLFHKGYRGRRELIGAAGIDG